MSHYVNYSWCSLTGSPSPSIPLPLLPCMVGVAWIKKIMSAIPLCSHREKSHRQCKSKTIGHQRDAFQLALQSTCWVHNLYWNRRASDVWGIFKPSKESMNSLCNCQNVIQLPTPTYWFPSIAFHSMNPITSEHQYSVEMAPVYAHWFPNSLEKRDLERTIA